MAAAQTQGAQRWAEMVNATESPSRTVQNGTRYGVHRTDWTVERRVVVTLAIAHGVLICAAGVCTVH